ncbi:MAG: Tfp pilus assembly protein FimT/FimU [Candidatus Paceibacterota bacterium]
MYPKNSNSSKGMTFLELTVVMSIFAIVSSITIFNYKTFQAKVDIRNLTNDIASKFTQAQRRALFGDLHPQGGLDWRPAYGLSFDLNASADTDNKTFYYFVDLDQEKDFDAGVYDCASFGVGECLEKVSITRGDYISAIEVFFEGDPIPQKIASRVDVVYTRPNAGAVITSPEIIEPLIAPISYVQLHITSGQSGDLVSSILVYASGRIQIN